MINVEQLIHAIGADFYTGVPDSRLKALCNYLIQTYGTDPKHHIIAANEGNCTALAAGYYLATGKTPVVYMQNSGEGNAINPITSLLDEHVYGIPIFFIIGWRGEPGIHDEPQHIYQGQITGKLLEDLHIPYEILDANTTEESIRSILEQKFRPHLTAGQSVAFVVREGALYYDQPVIYQNTNSMYREEIIRHIVAVSQTDPVVCTTGKASRELFELRVSAGQSHQYDFLTVGSMGHSSSIALGIAIHQPNVKIWCIDGDGAALMHMGAMAVIGSIRPKNLIHIVLNNAAHESVGGLPTVAGDIDLAAVARACGYGITERVDTLDALDRALASAKQTWDTVFLEVACGIGARDNLGRPTTTPMENKKMFMNYLETI